MVFESVVVELINRYLGAFVENLDTSQLKIGIWSGDIVLSQLNLKESALESLNIPIKIRAGHLAKLTLKIPWKNLYTEPAVIQIQGIYALVIRNQDIKYDEETIVISEQERKQARLARIEMHKKWEQEKEKSKVQTGDSFVEKLAVQIIKNLQIKISNIHIRLEDTHVDPKRPFSIGFTLHQLVFQTTDASWKEMVIKEAVSQIYKLVRLDSVSLYWNCMTDLLQEKTNKQILSAMDELIPKQGSKSNLQFLIKPISAVAHLRLNTKPEHMDFVVPKLQLTLVFDEIAIVLTKDQYDGVLEALESVERMYLVAKYKKTRPDGPYKGNYKKWWHHAYAVVLKYTVQRRRKMWMWKNIKRHRENLRHYRDLYTLKLEGKRLATKDVALIRTLEEELDIFSICMCRNQALLAIERQDKKREAVRSQMQQWFGNWYGGEGQEKASDGEEPKEPRAELSDRFQKEFTDGEKIKLYKAIGYDEKSKDLTYPDQFVAVRLVVKLSILSVTLIEHTKTRENYLLKLNLTEICASFGQRPAAKAIRLEAKVDQLWAIGFPRADYVPKLISSVGVSKESDTSLLIFLVETRPLDGMCDSRIRMQSRALEIIYDAITINALAAFFRLPESVKLKQLSNAAMARYDEIKAQTAAGVIHIMSERKYTDVEVHLMPSYIIMPETGELGRDVNMLLLNLGSFNVTSERTKEIPSGVQLSQSDLASYAYDKFNASLDNVQLLFVQPGDSWQNETLTNSPLYILRPVSMTLLIQKCLFSSDPNLPQFQVIGELPLVAMAVSDSKLLAIMRLIDSIPFPETSHEAKPFEFHEDTLLDATLMREVDLTRLSRVNMHMTSDFTNLTHVSVTFLIKEISIEMRETVNNTEIPFLEFIVIRIGATLKARTYDKSVVVYVGGVFLNRLEYKISQSIRDQLKKCDVITGEIVNIINSPFVDENEPLLCIHFIQADRRGPEFKTTYNNTAQSITIEFSTLDLILHQGVILSLMDFAKKFEPATANQIASGLDMNKRAISAVSSASRKSMSVAAQEKTISRSGIQLLKVKAIVDSIQFSICNARCVVMHTKVEGIELGIGMQNQKLGVTALMRKIEVTDPDPKTCHPNIFSVYGTEMFKFDLTWFMNLTEEKRFQDINTLDMIVSLQLGRARIVFVNKFIMSVVHFLDNFAVAKAKLNKASKAVKEASKDVARSLTQENAPHVKLNIVIKAPIAVIPQSSRSRSVLILHLGDVTVQNTFESGNIKSKTSLYRTWVTENMVIKLTNLYMTSSNKIMVGASFSPSVTSDLKGILQNELGNIASEILVILPLTFKVDVCRNLSCNYYHGIPQAEVKGVLEKIDIKLSQEDLRLIMQIATENIDERNPDGPSSPKARLVIVQGKQRVSDARSSCVSGATLRPPELKGKVYSTLRLDFQLLAINIELFRGLVNLFEPQSAKPQSKLLTYLTLQMLGVHTYVYSDSSMNASVYIHDINMDDCRQERAGGITKLIRRTAFKNMARESLKSRGKEEKENMLIHISFDQNSAKDKVVNIHICSLHLCLCVEFMMTVGDFFTKSMPQKDPDEIQQRAREVKAILERRDAVQTSKYSSDMEGSIDLTLQLEKPEIFFIADQMNPHTDSLIIDVQFGFNMMMTSEILNINGGIQTFSVISCIFQKEDSKKSYFNYFKWSQSKIRKISATEKHLLEICYNYYEHKWEMLPVLSYVLTPVNVTIMGSGPQSKDHHVDVNITDFIINITPSTVRLISSIIECESFVAAPELSAPKLKNYSNIWNRQKLKDCNFWFTQSVETVSSTNVKETEHEHSSSTSVKETITILYVKEKFLERKVRYYGNRLKEMLPRFLNLMIYAPVIALKLEGGVGNQTVPLIIMDASFASQMHNWTSDIYVKCCMGVSLIYNNENIGVWEPIIEPVLENKKSASHKWEFMIEMVKNPDMPTDKEGLLPPPKMTTNVVAVDALQLVVTKTCLDVLFRLGQALGKAYQLEHFEGQLGQKIIPFVLKNRLGTELSLNADPSLEVVSEVDSVDLKHFPSNNDVGLNEITEADLISKENVTQPIQHEEKHFTFQLSDSAVICNVHVGQAKKRLFRIDRYEVVVSVEAFIGQKIISFTSVLQIKSHLNAPMEIKYKSEEDLKSAGEVYPYKTFNVPLAALYNSTGEIFFQPKTEDVRFSVTAEGVVWKSLTENTKVRQMSCAANIEEYHSYYFNILPQFERLYLENTDKHTDNMITIHLHPTVIIHNLLPFPMQVTIKGTEEMHKLEAGNNIPLSHASVTECVLEVVIPKYRNHEWKALIFVELDVPELSTLKFQSVKDAENVYMDLGLHSKQKEGSLDLTVYSPYWIVNLTDQDIALQHETDQLFVLLKDDKEVMLFFYEKKSSPNDKTKKIVSLKVGQASWSHKFSLDTVGSGGNITCRNKATKNVVEIGVKIMLASSGLTKIVTFTPFYLLINATPICLTVREANKTTLMQLEPGECKSFYHESVTKYVKIVVKLESSIMETAPFFLNKAHTTLLRINDRFGGISAECQVNESAMITTFRLYKPGMASVLLVNDTFLLTFSIRQIGSTSIINMEPQTCELYTWSDPTAKRVIVWSCGNIKNIKSTLDRDKIDMFIIGRQTTIFFVTFLDGLQRVAMFTEDHTLAALALEAGELEQSDQEINIRISNMGFSLINNEKPVEVMYMGITSSGVIWEEKRKKNVRSMKIQNIAPLELAYQKYLMEIASGTQESPTVIIENNIEIDFNRMKMIRPHQSTLLRSFEDGIWMKIRKSPHYMQFHGKINRLQIDNQLRECIFPTILSPVPPPRSVVMDNVPKPFVEVSLITRIHENSTLIQVKYFKVLIQEMNLMIDHSFLSELFTLFAVDVHTLRERELVKFKEDFALTQRELKEEAGVSMQAKRVSFYDYFHISPIKIHLSFSLERELLIDGHRANVFIIFLKSVGIVLTDVQNVVFKLGYFERTYCFYNNSELTREFIKHYTGQAVKQMYVLVLGLDVLGNPFGLLRGLTEGIEDLFYEPYQGAILGPQEFVKGLQLGVRSLFSHTVGGTAGAVSKITSTLSKGLAVLTFDEEYQKKHHEKLIRRPSTARDSIAQGGKELFMGVYFGIVGIVVKPIEGFTQAGPVGFIKGVGKGLIGIVIKPVSGLLDFATMTLEGIYRYENVQIYHLYRLTDFSEEIHRLRPPRNFSRDGIITPYVREEAEGYSLLLEIDKGKYSGSDEYVAHVKIKENGKKFFMLTDKRIMLAKYGGLFGHLDTEWMCTYEELQQPPKMTKKGIEILYNKNLFGDGVNKDIPLADPEVVNSIIKKITSSMPPSKVKSNSIPTQDIESKLSL